MNNVGIITFHCSYNYGSALQAYALQTYVESLGYNVRIIDFVMKKNFEQYKLFRTSLYRKQLKSLGADIIFFPHHLKRKLSFEKFVQKKMHLTEKRYYSCTELKELNNEIDIFICGSDQIWNIDCTHGIEPSYFLKFVNDNNTKIAYAPSLAHIKFETENKEEFKALLESFDAISIREESTVPYLQSIVKQEVKVTLDPTLLLNESDYLPLLTDGLGKEKYIFVYMLEGNKELIQYCENLKKLTGYQLYYLSLKVNCGFSCGKNLFGISPEKFLSYIYHAKYVITNSFHATVFSIIFNKQFCTFPTKKSSASMVDLLEKIGLLNRLYGQKFVLDNRIDYKTVEKKINELRVESTAFLNNTLANGENYERK